MKLWAEDEVGAKSRFWYFLKKYKKVKKANGEVIACNEVRTTKTVLNKRGHDARIDAHTLPCPPLLLLLPRAATHVMFRERIDRRQQGKETRVEIRERQWEIGDPCCCTESVCTARSPHGCVARKPTTWSILY